MLITITVLSILFLISYIRITRNSFLEEYTLEINTFNSAMFTLGLTYEVEELSGGEWKEDITICTLRIGLYFFNLKLSTHKFSKEVLGRNPELRKHSMSWWQLSCIPTICFLF
jgi:hypothetical protein